MRFRFQRERKEDKGPALEAERAISLEPTVSIDNRKAECPYCQGALRKVPAAKTKCPHCQRFMYVRTRPDHIRVVVTEDELRLIEEEWSIASGYHDEYVAERAIEAEVIAQLKRQFGGKEPSEADVRWALLNREMNDHAANQNWGHYRNSRLSMADELRKEGKLEHSLATYLEVCYIDLNGPNNCGGYEDFPDLLKEFPPFDPSQAFLAPGLIERIQRLMRSLTAGVPDVKALFFEHSSAIHGRLLLPVTPGEAWPQLESTISVAGR